LQSVFEDLSERPAADLLVIGSGPSGVAAAHALCSAGRSVTLLDAGDRIEAGRMDVFESLARLEPSSWPSETARRARDTFHVDVRHVPLRPSYGSLFPYVRGDDLDLPIVCDNADTLPSLAHGGLSNSWGASILPVRQADIADWPISLAELEPHYEAVLRFVPIAAERDELAETLPLYSDSPVGLRRSPQTQALLNHLRGHATALTAAGFSFGASRLAVRASTGDPGGCRYCGMCHYGCPYGVIYNASQTLDALVRGGGLDYRSGIYVDRLSEGECAVTVDFHRRGSVETGQLTASRVFVACGAISTTRLMLDSMGRSRLDRRLQDSQYFLVPMLNARASRVSTQTQGNTLAQLFIELDDARVSGYTVHMQLYGYNDLMLSPLARRVPLPAAKLERLLQPLLGRLLVVQGYLHSAESPGLSIRRDADRVRVVGERGTVGTARVKRLVRRLAASGRLLGMLPMPGLAQVGLPGKGNHIGGSLPMRRAPAELETDTLGRPPGWRRVHVVDASVLPSIPATTVTISVMANAHRIATLVAGPDA
jgi:choline dehydrogenase-like flavoprotein